MYKFISDILKESEEDIDDFFKPKNLKSREEKFERENEVYVNKVLRQREEIREIFERGIIKISKDWHYKNFDSEIQQEFCKIFSDSKPVFYRKNPIVDIINQDHNNNLKFLKSDMTLIFFQPKLPSIEKYNVWISGKEWDKIGNFFHNSFAKTDNFFEIMLIHYFNIKIDRIAVTYLS